MHLDRQRGCVARFEAVASGICMVVGYPFADGLPMRFDGFEGLDVEGRIVVDVENCLPKSMEEEFDFTGAVDGSALMAGGAPGG
jgi:hypothetical protein